MATKKKAANSPAEAPAATVLPIADKNPNELLLAAVLDEVRAIRKLLESGALMKLKPVSGEDLFGK